MFTGLVECMGRIVSAKANNGGKDLFVDLSGLSRKVTIGASIALNGACQTVVEYHKGIGRFFAAPETLKRTTLGKKNPGDVLNLESALRVGDSLDGHIVSGHIDTTTAVLDIHPAGNSQIWRFALPQTLIPFIAEKGSIAIDGISLTVVEATMTYFTVSIIPHTLTHTTLPLTHIGDMVNIEVDILARYVSRQITQQPSLTEDFLHKAGF